MSYVDPNRDESLNVFGEKLISCGNDIVTGFYRDNSCNTCEQDVGSHTICVQMTQEFLEYSRFKGNDLSTPIPEHGFDGVKPGNTWCLCAARWLEAHEDDMAPRVYLTKTHIKALDIIPIDVLRLYGMDLN
jgi:uncharacterized protein (DUF2237 family)